MKRLAFLTTTLFLLMAVGASQAQTQPATNESKKEIKKEIRQEKKAKKLTLRKLNGTAINPKAKKNFEAKYGKAPRTRFARRNYFDVATFIKDDIELNAYFDFDGNYVGSTSEVKFAAIPLAGQKNIKKDYKDYTVRKVVFFKDNEKNDTDMMLYGIQFDDEDTYFVELTKGKKTIVVQVTPTCKVYYFTSI